MAEFPTGAAQLIVTYGTAEFPGLQGAGLTRGLMARVADDAAARAQNLLRFPPHLHGL